MSDRFVGRFFHGANVYDYEMPTKEIWFGWYSFCDRKYRVFENKRSKNKNYPNKEGVQKKKRIWKWFKRVYFLESFAELFNRVKKEKPLKNEGIWTIFFFVCFLYEYNVLVPLNAFISLILIQILGFEQFYECTIWFATFLDYSTVYIIIALFSQ